MNVDEVVEYIRRDRNPDRAFVGRVRAMCWRVFVPIGGENIVLHARTFWTRRGAEYYMRRWQEKERASIEDDIAYVTSFGFGRWA